MKRIIYGTMYNTEKSELIHRWNGGLNDNDISELTEELYKTQFGEYFIVDYYGSGADFIVRADVVDPSIDVDLDTVWRDHILEWLDSHGGSDKINNIGLIVCKNH